MLFLLALGCIDDAPTYEYGIDLAALEFQLYDLDMGVYPNNSLLDDPNNPFAEFGLGPTDKWELFDAGVIPGFYAFGTVLVYEPTGENQFYAASSAASIYLTEQAAPDELWAVREIAIAGYHSVIDNFQGSLTYDATGTVAYEVVPLAEDGLIALGADQ